MAQTETNYCSFVVFWVCFVCFFAEEKRECLDTMDCDIDIDIDILQKYISAIT